MVFTVSKAELEDLERKMLSLIPESIAILSILHSLKKGAVTAKFYTDDWPQVSVVVCEIFSPRISDVADLVCYAATGEALCCVLKESELITYGKRQLISQVDSRHADYLMNELKPLEDSSRLECIIEAFVYYLPDGLKGEERACPNEFMIGNLAPRHASYVASEWKYFDDWPNKISYFEDLLRNPKNSVAIFHVDNPDIPVSWNLLYTSGQQGHLYTINNFRRKGLASIVKRELCKSIIANGLLPELQVSTDNLSHVDLILKLGFVRECRKLANLIVYPPTAN